MNHKTHSRVDDAQESNICRTLNCLKAAQLVGKSAGSAGLSLAIVYCWLNLMGGYCEACMLQLPGRWEFCFLPDFP